MISNGGGNAFHRSGGFKAFSFLFSKENVLRYFSLLS